MSLQPGIFCRTGRELLLMVPPGSASLEKRWETMATGAGVLSCASTDCCSCCASRDYCSCDFVKETA
jgi:hypothetical protein